MSGEAKGDQELAISVLRDLAVDEDVNAEVRLEAAKELLRQEQFLGGFQQKAEGDKNLWGQPRVRPEVLSRGPIGDGPHVPHAPPRPDHDPGADHE